MPSLIRVSLIPDEELIYHLPSSGRIAQSIVMNSLNYIDPDLALEVREQARDAPPFSVGQITAPHELVESSLKNNILNVPAGQELRMFVGLCRDDLVNPLLKGLEGIHRISGVDVRGKPEILRREPYEDLVGEVAKIVSLRTRTALILGSVTIKELKFDRYDPWKRSLEPLHIMATPYKTWNAYSGSSIPAGVFRGMSSIEIRRVKLRRRIIKGPFGGQLKPIEAYEGEILLSLGALDTFVGSLALALMKLAEYSGLGSRTMQGFGSVSLKIL